MLDSWISYAEGFILVYAVDDKESFEDIKGRYERIMRNKANENPSIIVVGNKCDLVDKRKVDTQIAEQQCKEWKVNFMEVSALEKINVKESFLTVARDLLSKKVNAKGGNSEEENKKRCFCF
jgi:GTPase SAR1 family protein